MSDTNQSSHSQQDRFRELPDDIQEAMTSVDSTKIMKEIADKHHLHIDQGGALADETGKLMFGDTPPQDFVAHVKRAVRVDEKTAHEIAEEVNTRIFRPIRQSLKDMYHMNERKKQETARQETPKNGSSDGRPFSAENAREGVHELPHEKKKSGTQSSTAGADQYRESIDDNDAF